MICEEFVQEYLDTGVLPTIQGKQGEELISSLVEIWENYCIYAKMMDRTFEYLNRFFLKNN